MKSLVPRAGLMAAACLLVASSAVAQDSTKPRAMQARVWVNNNTKVYHCPGNPYYGKTTNGEFMKEAQARGLGVRAYTGTGCGNVATPRLAPLPDSTADSKRLVWVNTDSNIYHCPNSRTWGATQRGKYLPESDASASGHRPAGGKKCSAP